MGEKSLQQCSSVYFQAPSGKLVSNLIQVGWGLGLCNAIFLFNLFFFFFLFLTKCTLTFQCAATLGEEECEPLLLETMERPLERMESTEAAGEKLCMSLLVWMQKKKNKKNLKALVFVFNLCVFIMACATVISADRFSSHKCITTINYFYKKSIYLKVFAS